MRVEQTAIPWSTKCIIVFCFYTKLKIKSRITKPICNLMPERTPEQREAISRGVRRALRSDGSVPFVGPLPSKMADFDGTLSDFGTLPALNSAYLEKDIYFLSPRTDYARRYQVGVWGGTFPDGDRCRVKPGMTRRSSPA